MAERMSQSPFIANPPSVFLDPIVSSDHVVCNDPVTIREIVMDPDGVSGVEIHFWVVNKATGKTRYEFKFANDICSRWTLFTSGTTDYILLSTQVITLREP